MKPESSLIPGPCTLNDKTFSALGLKPLKLPLGAAAQCSFQAKSHQIFLWLCNVMF